MRGAARLLQGRRRRRGWVPPLPPPSPSLRLDLGGRGTAATTTALPLPLRPDLRARGGEPRLGWMPPPPRVTIVGSRHPRYRTAHDRGAPPPPFPSTTTEVDRRAKEEGRRLRKNLISPASIYMPRQFLQADNDLVPRLSFSHVVI